MDHQANLAGPKSAFRLGEKTYFLSQPTDKDMQTIQKYLGMFLGKKSKGWLERLVEKPSWAKLSPAQQDMLLRDAMELERSGQTPLFEANTMMEVLSSVDVTRFMTWLLLRKDHPTLDKAKDVDPFIDESNVDAVFVQLDEGTGMADLGNSDGRPGSN